MMISRYSLFRTALGAFAALSLLAAGPIVREGVPSAEAFFEVGGHESAPGVWRGTGRNGNLHSRFLYPGDVTVEAELSLEKLAGTAASLSVQGVNWGFDGGKSHSFFLEAKHLEKTTISPPRSVLTPGRFFTVKVVCRNGMQSCFINGELLADRIPAAPGTKGEIFLRPHRNTMSVKNFRVEGVRGEELAAAKEPAIWFRSVPLGADFIWQIAGAEFRQNERIDLVITPRDGIPPIRSEASAIAPDRLRVPAAALAAAYRAAGGSKNARRLAMRSADRRHRLFFTAVDPAQRGDFMRGTIMKCGDFSRIAFDGKPSGTISGHLGFFVSQAALPGLQRFGAAGIHGSITLLELYRHIDDLGNFDEAGFLAEFDSIAAQAVACDPEVNFKLYPLLFMPAGWCRRNPKELIVLDNGLRTISGTPEGERQPSLASAVWRERMGEILRTAISALRRSPYADRIGYCRVRYGNCGEWNHWGYNEKAFVDFSEPMRRAFSSWLRRRYGDAAALRAAWGDPKADFDAPELIPGRERRMDFPRVKGSPGQAAADYYEFFQELTAETILHFTRIVKEAGDRRLLTAAYYGYYLGCYSQAPFHFQDSGHFGTRFLLNSPEIDIFGGPCQYAARRQFIEVNGITGSLALHNKLWETEDDLRTSASGRRERAAGAHDDPAESIALLKRDYMLNLSRRCCFYFYDFARDWYADPGFMATVKRLAEIDAAFFSIRRPPAAEVGVIFDEEGIPLLPNRPDQGLQLRRRKWREEISRWGVPTGFYLKSDLDRLDPQRTPILIFAEGMPDENGVAALKKRGFAAVLPLELEAAAMRQKLADLTPPCHLWTNGRAWLVDCFIAPPLVGIFSRRAGSRSVMLPHKVEVVADLFTGEIIARGAKGFRCDTPATPETRIFFAGNERDLAEFLPGTAKRSAPAAAH